MALGAGEGVMLGVELGWGVALGVGEGVRLGAESGWGVGAQALSSRAARRRNFLMGAGDSIPK
ncbi:MAG: hypothetical protein Fur0035_22610 [Anaerolineales bacterium]